MSQMAVYSVNPCQLPRERFTPTELHNGALAHFLDSPNEACAKIEFVGLVHACTCAANKGHTILSDLRLTSVLRTYWANYITHTRARKLLHFR